MRGRKPKLKAVDGGLKKAPPMPETLPGDMAQVWTEIAADLQGRGLLTTSMTTVLETYVGAIWTARECRKAIAEFGPIVKGSSGMPKANPANQMLKNANETVARLAAELGLTPSSRSRPGVMGQEKKAADATDPWANLDL